MTTTEAGTLWANPGPETVLFSGRASCTPQLTTLVALDRVDRADIGPLEIVAGHARNVVIKAAGIAEGLDRLCGAEAIAALLEDDIRTSQRTWQLACSSWCAAKYSLWVQPKFS